jgi:hypothetical protein
LYLSDGKQKLTVYDGSSRIALLLERTACLTAACVALSSGLILTSCSSNIVGHEYLRRTSRSPVDGLWLDFFSPAGLKKEVMGRRINGSMPFTFQE